MRIAVLRQHRTDTWLKRLRWSRVVRASYVPDSPPVRIESINARMIRLDRERRCA